MRRHGTRSGREPEEQRSEPSEEAISFFREASRLAALARARRADKINAGDSDHPGKEKGGCQQKADRLESNSNG